MPIRIGLKIIIKTVSAQPPTFDLKTLLPRLQQNYDTKEQGRLSPVQASTDPVPILFLELNLTDLRFGIQIFMYATEQYQ